MTDWLAWVLLGLASVAWYLTAAGWSPDVGVVDAAIAPLVVVGAVAAAAEGRWVLAAAVGSTAALVFVWFDRATAEAWNVTEGEYLGRYVRTADGWEPLVGPLDERL